MGLIGNEGDGGPGGGGLQGLPLRWVFQSLIPGGVGSGIKLLGGPGGWQGWGEGEFIVAEAIRT